MNLNLKEIEMQILNLLIIDRYEELDKTKHLLMNKSDDKSNNYDFVYQHIREELLKIHNDPVYVTDVLVEYLYAHKKTAYKSTLWNSFGDILIANLKRNLGNTIQCEDCNERFEPTKQRQRKCLDCQEKTKKEKARLRKIKFNNKKKNRR